MFKKNILLALIVALGSMVFSASFAAQGAVPIQAKINLTQDDRAVTNANVSAALSEEKININGSLNAKNQDNEIKEIKVKVEKEGDSSLIMGEAHRSTVAVFVRGLLAVADHEDGIGAKVRVIAKAQQDSQKTTSDALTGVESYGSFKTFFVGTDYKNIGVLRSQMVVTANQIDQLKKFADQATNSTNKAELEAQIKILEQDQNVIDTFIKLNEAKFSLFGWLFR